MPAWLFHGWAEDAVAAAKAAGTYGVALIGLRFSPRRTLSQWTAILAAHFLFTVCRMHPHVALGRIEDEPSVPDVGERELKLVFQEGPELVCVRAVEHRVHALDHGRSLYAQLS